jgi:plasmid maintenance system antidote protein VapI
VIEIWSYRFKNLEIEMIRANITRKNMAQKLGVSYNTMSNKINNLKPFTREEMFKIKEILKSKLSLDLLFKLEEVEDKNK